ncbi:hypothetical protein SDC9_199209 [bioreactor metagenome]|uniref:Uncharacterized protein n=1 Tax=bioreactor metagenome TaxID=1076179 RepID=A0A645IJU1_9ZZZZ
MGVDAHAHAVAAHVQHDGFKLPALALRSAIKQCDGIAWLQAQHLHMAHGAFGQVDFGAANQRYGAVKAGHAELFALGLLLNSELLALAQYGLEAIFMQNRHIRPNA